MIHTSLNLSCHYLAKGAGSQSLYAQYHVATPRQQGNRGSGSATTKGCHIDSPGVASDGKVVAPMTLCLGK